MRKKLFSFSLIQFITSIICFTVCYVFYHFVGDGGFTVNWQSDPGKPFVTLLIGFFATLFLFGAVSSTTVALIFTKKD